MLHLVLWSLLATVAVASFGSNLNYRSPSLNHPSLGISIHKVTKRHVKRETLDPHSLNFTHGVASGDPYASSVILWTRCSPVFDDVSDNSTVTGPKPLYNPVPIYDSSGAHAPSSTSPVCVQWKIAKDKQLAQVVDSGTTYTSSDVDYTIKVEAQHLAPFTTYYYQFNACGADGNKSPLGRTKTAPASNSAVDSIKFAVYSCSNYPFGYFNAYRNPALKDSVDYTIHLGDFIYEYKNGDYGYGQTIQRIPLPDKETYTLYDYRKRHATYHLDSGLPLSQQQFPMIAVWDDHEVSDNTYRDGASELNNTEASFVKDGGVSVDQRKMNAVRAYFEWMPLRQVEMDDNLRIWRNFQMGDLLDLVMLDTRHYDRSITDLYWNTEYVQMISQDTGRSMMGSRQENWFYRQLQQSQARGARWRLIGSQTVFSRLNESIAYGDKLPLDYDAWDGYQSNRNRTFQTLYEHNIGNNIMMSGDSHANWVSDLVWLDAHAYDSSTGVGAVGVEFAGTAVTSPSPAGQNISIARANNASAALVAANRELQWSELYYRGYYELYVTHDSVRAQYFGHPTIVTANANEISLANFTVRAGENRLAREANSSSSSSGLVGGGVVANGYLRGGRVVQTNVTNNTQTGHYFVSHEDQEDL